MSMSAINRMKQNIRGVGGIRVTQVQSSRGEQLKVSLENVRGGVFERCIVPFAPQIHTLDIFEDDGVLDYQEVLRTVATNFTGIESLSILGELNDVSALTGNSTLKAVKMGNFGGGDVLPVFNTMTGLRALTLYGRVRVGDLGQQLSGILRKLMFFGLCCCDDLNDENVRPVLGMKNLKMFNFSLGSVTYKKMRSLAAGLPWLKFIVVEEEGMQKEGLNRDNINSYFCLPDRDIQALFNDEAVKDLLLDAVLGFSAEEDRRGKFGELALKSIEYKPQDDN